jgi:N6-adenosine-specific RNA methylase IME4
LYPETRHGLTSERAEVNRNNFVLPPAFTEDTADKTGQSRRTIEQEIQIARDITPEVKDKIRDTELADRKTDLLRLARMEPNQQEQIVDKIVSGEADTINHAKKILAAENVKSVELPEGKYRVIYADPPWQYGGCMNPDAGMAADLQYPTMPLDEIAALPVADLAADNAVLFLWTTSPLLQDSFTIINAWGFQYKASFVWDKVKHNFGYYNSVRHEFLLVCTKGSCTPDNSKLYDSVQSIERTEHSKKPEEFRQIIDDLYPSGPRIELFAREPADNWQSWGNQV